MSHNVIMMKLIVRNLHNPMLFEKKRRLITVYCIFFFPLVFVKTAQAQNQIIEIDKITHAAKTQPPFDLPFIIKVPRPSKENTVTEVVVYESFMLKNGVRSYLDKKGKEGKKLQSPDFKQEGEFLNIYMDPVEPNTYLELILRNRLHGKKLTALLDLNQLIATGDPIKIEQAKVKFSEWRKKLDEDSPYIFSVSAFGFSWLPDFWTGYLTFYQTDLKIPYRAIASRNYVENQGSLTITNLTKLASWGVAQGLNSDELSELVGLLGRTESWDLFMKGQTHFGTKATSKSVDQYDLQSRIEMLSQNMADIDSLLRFCDQVYLYSSVNRTDIQTIKSDLEKVLVKLNSNKRFTEANLKMIISAITSNENLRYSEVILVDNKFAELKTESGARVTPDLGIAQIVAFGNSENTYLQRPYYGLNITARPLNKEIRFKEYPKYIKSVWHRLSFSVGVTAGKLPDGEFEDLYNNVSLLTGLNCRLFRGFYLSSGVVWMKQKSPNPIITDAKTEPALYFGLSLDLDITGPLKTVTGKFL